MKHVIEPFVTVRRLSQIDVFEEIVQLEGIDSIVGGVTQIQYGLNNRLYGRGGSFGDVAREILTVALNQSYYTDDRAAQYDRRFSTSFNNTGRTNFSPVALTVRSAPTNTLSASLRTEFDSQFKAFRTFSAEGTYEHGGWIATSWGWSQRRFIEQLPGFNDPDFLDHYINSSTSVRNRSNSLGGAYRFNYDILRDSFLQQRVLVYYNAQCCGVSVEYQTFNFGGLVGRARVPFAQDKRFNLSFTLAGLGTFANVFGAFGSGSELTARSDTGQRKEHGAVANSTVPVETKPPERIDGVRTKRLRLIPDERGWLMEILRSDDAELFQKFGQVYVSATYPGVVKAWHYHKHQIDNFACIAGMVKLVLVDTREDSPTNGVVNEFFLGTQQPMIVQVPNLVYHGWKCVSPEASVVVNVPTELYRYDDPDEYRLAPHGTLPYDWTRQDG